MASPKNMQRVSIIGQLFINDGKVTTFSVTLQAEIKKTGISPYNSVAKNAPIQLF
jgi:hypothetical protein